MFELRGLNESLEQFPKLFEEEATIIPPARIVAALRLRSCATGLAMASAVRPVTPVLFLALGWLGASTAEAVLDGLDAAPTPPGRVEETDVPVVRACWPDGAERDVPRKPVSGFLAVAVD